MSDSDILSLFTPGEKLLWSGRPGQGFLLTSRDFLLVPFSLLWGGFAIFWEITAISTETPVFTKLWGIPFVLMGLYLMAGRFFVDAAARARTEYVLTNRRVIIRRSGLFRHLSTNQLELLPSISLEEGSRGKGTIKFCVPSNRRMSGWTPSLANEPQLLGIEDARHVYSLLETARSDCTSSR
ncbi:hypothetical protein CO653_02390 [Rhizobium anhuiense]|uniref:PH domain-containing protein n=1 Tax=Rhizobium anhuiense TaxID=1184720 RepID=UPI000BEA3D3F|nr:PH domain-containing protein [Rhizobium anhuiense]PDS60557.1 hypothetical protein CO663_02470 [Rhizobium anhuiense]PDS67166.1 hypothetical protein CO653_02390 [Rhizobium anhuiense]